MPVFKNMPDGITVLPILFKQNFLGKIQKAIFYKRHNVKYIFPGTKNLSWMGIISVFWIPDFQHHHLPNLFSKAEIEKRNNDFRKIAQSKHPMILSSYDCRNDFQQYYSQTKNNVYVVPFVSFIEPEIRTLTIEREHEILAHFGLLPRKYIMVANQFWQHKNHIAVLKAIQAIQMRDHNCGLQFVFTGQMKDHRNIEYIDELKKYMQRPEISRCLINLGFIAREAQIAIMKNAQYVIQPSLFEGWGTVVEDAKVLDKWILLSNISIHREQMNDKCVLFDPFDPCDLADKILQMMHMNHCDNIEAGIRDMHTRAKVYSNGFWEMLDYSKHGGGAK